MTARVQKLVEDVSDLRAAGQPGCLEIMEKLVADLQDIVASKGAYSTTAPIAAVLKVMEAGNQGSEKSSMDLQLSPDGTNADSVESDCSESEDEISRILKKLLKGKRQRSMRPGEEATVHSFFHRKICENHLLSWDMEHDIDERIACAFWADCGMQLDYFFFGDSIYFDTSYRSNKDDHPLALFVGYNQHRQLCIFGAALLYDETVQTFEWLFKTFLKCMSDKRPVSIFTDHCSEIASGIKSVLPGTFHGISTFCITQAAKEKLGQLCESDFLGEFVCFMNGVVDEADFDSKWTSMVDRYVSGKSTVAQKWLKSIYGVKKQWSSAWVRKVFSASIHDSALSKQCYDMLRGLIQPELTLEECLIQFDLMVEKCRALEKLTSEATGVHMLPNCNSKLLNTPIGELAAREYTQAIYKLFQDEYEQSFGYGMTPNKSMDAGSLKAYSVFKEESGLKSDVTTVMVDSPGKHKLTCSCFLFESSGLLCRHVLRAMKFVTGEMNLINMAHVNIMSHYTMTRWTIKARYIADYRSWKLAEGSLLYSLRFAYLTGKFAHISDGIRRMGKEDSRRVMELVYKGLEGIEAMIESERLYALLATTDVGPARKGFKVRTSPVKLGKRTRKGTDEAGSHGRKGSRKMK
ncbi:Protein FAR1-RELATED SEQUENCE 3 [Linum perenne]